MLFGNWIIIHINKGFCCIKDVYICSLPQNQGKGTIYIYIYMYLCSWGIIQPKSLSSGLSELSMLSVLGRSRGLGEVGGAKWVGWSGLSGLSFGGLG